MRPSESSSSAIAISSGRSFPVGLAMRSPSTVIVVPPVSAPKAAAKTPSPAGFPKEDAATRASAKDRQREIIARELAQEEAILSRAKKDFAEQEAIRYGDEKNDRKVLDRLRRYRENVELHEKNVQELRKELGNIR